MYDLIVYKTLTNPYFRIVRVADGFVMTTLTGVLAIDTSWATSYTALAKDAVIGGIPVKIPTGLVAGNYDILFYDAAAPAASDVVQIGRRLAWTGRLISGIPIDV